MWSSDQFVLGYVHTAGCTGHSKQSGERACKVASDWLMDLDKVVTRRNREQSGDLRADVS